MALLKYLAAWNLPSRVNRIRYFVINSIYTLLLCASMALFLVPAIGLVVFSMIIIFFCINNIVLTTKRLHDIGLSGWWYLLIPIPIVGVIFTLVIFFCGGTKGSNKFGSQPAKASKLEYILTFIFIPLNTLLILTLAFISSILEGTI